VKGTRAERLRLAAVLLLLVVLHFSVRNRLGDPRVAPDFLLLALLVYAVRAAPGPAAVAGFLFGLLTDALNPIGFGSGALALTVVGFVAAWGKTVFFAENLIVSGVVFFVGTWLRNVIVLAATGALKGDVLWWTLGVWAPLQGLTTALVGIVVLWVFRRWLAIRLGEA
jgi:rod shape-determining protein MreD